MRTNTASAASRPRTHGGAIAQHISYTEQLSRSVMSCFLFENEFYEDGVSISKRILDLCNKVAPETIGQMAVEARTTHGLRHVSLLLLVGLLNSVYGGFGSNRQWIGDTIRDTIQRADEMGELLALYRKVNGGDAKISKQLKRGLAMAFQKFDEYQLAKWDNSNAAFRVRDVMFITHPKPTGEQAALYARVAAQVMQTPDTWETQLSSGADKKATFERLIGEGNLGYMALLRNLRNMIEADVDRDLIEGAILARKGAKWVLPFRYVAAARAVPQLEPVLDQALQQSLREGPRLRGRTTVLVDVSGSMLHPLSTRSDLNRMDAAATLASMINADQLRVFTFSNRVAEVAPRRGMAGVDAIVGSQMHGGTEMSAAVRYINQMNDMERLIVITDEQSTSWGQRCPDPVVGVRGYMINVASARNGVGYGAWTHIDGFSEQVLKYIVVAEQQQDQ